MRPTRPLKVVVTLSNLDSLVVVNMLICSSRLAGMPASTNASSK